MNTYIVSFLSQYNARGSNQTLNYPFKLMITSTNGTVCSFLWKRGNSLFFVSLSMWVLQIGHFLIPDSPAQHHWRKCPAASSAAQHPCRTPLWFYPGRRWWVGRGEGGVSKRWWHSAHMQSGGISLDYPASIQTVVTHCKSYWLLYLM